MLLLHLIIFSVGALAYVLEPVEKLYELEEAEAIFEEFIKKHNKVYADEEEKQMRFEIFKEKLELVNELMAERGRQATFDINHFSDWTEEEFKSRYLGFEPSQNISKSKTEPVTTDLPDSFDWRLKNAVTPIKDQKQCLSCWAFSTTGTVEGAYAIKHKKLLSFSEQQLVDCDVYDNGCNRGNMDKALTYLRAIGGIESESDYPYMGTVDKCSFNSRNIKAQIVGYHHFELSDDDAVKQALIKYGPISIAVYASSTKFQHYNGTILDCPPGPPDHAVLLVGYGKENGKTYWIIKNSWGRMWGGGSGYIKVLAGNNPCGMNDYGGVVAVVE